MKFSPAKWYFFWDEWKAAAGLVLRGFKSNVLRTVLSLLGVSIGIFSVIAIFTAVDSLQDYLINSLSRLGSNVLYIDRIDYTKMGNIPWSKIRRLKKPSYDEYLFLKKNLDPAKIKGISYRLSAPSRNVKSRGQSVKAFMFGVNADFYKMVDVRLHQGRFFNEMEDQRGLPVVVLGADVAEALFPDGKALGKYVKIFGKPVKVIGVLERDSGIININPSNDRVFLPYAFVRKILPERSRMFFTSILVLPAGAKEKKALIIRIEQLLRRYRHLKPGEENDFHVNDINFLKDNIQTSMHILTLAGWILGGFSLLVGAFGIANIMFVSVKERTAEIGIQKAIGASKKFILSEFLTESVLLSLIGGAFGLLVLLFFIYTGNRILNDPSFVLRLNLKNILIALVISISIGLLAGIWPAWKASKMNPIDAIRRKI